MPKLLSGSTLRTGGSGEFIDLKGAMPQLPPTETTATGFTLVTDSLLRTTYRSSLGFIEFRTATMYSSLPEGTIRIKATGTSFLSYNTQTGTLVVEGGVGIGANMHVAQDIVVNDITIGKGYEGTNNISIVGDVSPRENDFTEGQNSITIGYDTLKGLETSFKTIAIGVEALSSGSNLSETIAIGDSALKNLGVKDLIHVATITNVVIRPSISITNITNENPLKITAPGHNLISGDQIYVTGVSGISLTSTSTGVYSLVNDQTLFVNVVDPNTLAIYYNNTLTVTANATSATAYISSGTITLPVRITVATGSQLTTGLYVHADGINGTTELNNSDYYLKQISSNVYDLYDDPILEQPINGTGFTSYISDGYLVYFPPRRGNVSYGHSSGENLTEGTNNIFIGNNSAQALTTGSNNIFIGNNKAFDVFRGSGIISIGGDNIVNGLDNQLNIGSVYYYNGTGTNTIRAAETLIGLGAESTSTNTGALQVLGGAGIRGNVALGGNLLIKDSNIKSITTSVATLSATNIDSYSLSQYRAAKYFVQISEGSGATAKFLAQEISLIASNTGSVNINVYGTVSTDSPGGLGTFDAIVTGTNVSLRFTPNSVASKVIKLLRTTL